MGSKGSILKGSAADLQDLRWRRAARGSSADLAMPAGSPAKAGVRTVAPGFNRGKGDSSEVGARFSGRKYLQRRPSLSPAEAGSRNSAASRPPAEAGGYGSYDGFAAEGHSVNGSSVNG
jgi:hypothetical protein